MNVLHILLFVVVLCILIYSWNRRKLYLVSMALPGPVALPILGNSLHFLNHSTDILNVIMKLTSSYESPMRLWMGHKLIIFVKDPNQLQLIMQSPKMSTKSFVYGFLEPFMGKGLFTSAGNQHKQHRKLLQPLFGSKYLEGYSHLFQKHAGKFVELISSNANGAEFDVLNLLHESAFEATMDILLEDKNDHSVDYKELPVYVRRFYKIFFHRVMSFWLYPDFIYRQTKYFKEQDQMVNMAQVLIKEIREAKLPEILKNIEIGKVTDSRIPSILELITEILHDNPECLQEQEVLDHMYTFVVTSQDTQSSAIAFTLMMLGMHPQIQAKVVDELKETIGNSHCINFDDAGKLKFMEMCIKESMRLFPLGPFLLRTAVEDFQLENHVLPQGTEVVLGIYNVHKNPDHWEKPHEFYPEHFTPESVANRHQYAFLPFSAGPRRCIAQQYSYLNMKIIIGNILQKYVIECDGTLNELELLVDVSIRPSRGYFIRIKERI